jgi:hypothetical protein
MATYNDFTRSFQVNAAISAGSRVALSHNGSIGVAGDRVLGIGVIDRDCSAAAYENPKVRFYGTGSVGVAVTGGPATAGDKMYCLATGQVGPTSAAAGNGIQFGILLQSYSAGDNGTIAEVLPVPAPTAFPLS